MLTGAETRWRMMLTCSRAFSTDSIAQGNEPSAPPCDAAITRSASITPAIGASTIGNSVLMRSRSRRSGHMVCSLGYSGIGASIVASHRDNISTPQLCSEPPSGNPAPQRNHRPDRLNQDKRSGSLQKSVHRTERAGCRKADHEPMAAFLQRITQQHGGNGEQSE